MGGSASVGVAVLLAVGLWTGASDPVRAQEVEARAYLSAAQVGVGRQFVLNLEVSGVQQLDGEPTLPPMEEFARYLGTGTSTSVQIAGGRTTVSITYQHRFMATREGTFEIGPIQVAAGGRALETAPVTVVISDAPQPGSGAGQGAAAAQGAGAGTDDPVGPDDLFVEAAVSKTRAFENEPVTVEYRILTQVNVESYSITDLPLATGFLTEELEQPESPQVERVVRNGREYVSAVIRRTALFPTGPGTKTLDPIGLEAQVRVRNRSFDPFGDIFGRSSLLDSRVPVAVRSRPVEIEVLPLPPGGRPASFRGHVGDLSVSTSVDRASVNANEAVTFRVEMTGTGNLRTLPPPEIDFPSEFEVFPPEAGERISPSGGNLQGVRSFDYVLIPRVPGRVSLPPVEVSSFDPRAQTYRTSRAGPIEVSVVGTVAGEGTGAVPSAVEAVREEIRFIHVGRVRFAPVGRRLFATGGFWVALFLPLAAVAGAGAYRRHRDRLEGDVAYARTRRAGRMARKRLAKAKELASGDPRAFYAEVAGALQGFLADKINVSAASLVREEVGREAAARGASPETLRRLFECLDHCDRQRFAPAGAEREPPEQVLERAATLMAELAKELST